MSTTRKWCMAACFGLLCLFMASVLIRSFTVNVVQKRLHINNAITQALLFDDVELKEIGKPKDNSQKDILIKWSELYPFKEETQKVPLTSKKENIVTKISNKIENKTETVRKKVSNWTTGYLAGYVSFGEACNAYKKLLHWNIMPRTEYNSIVEIDDGQLAAYKNREDMSEIIKNTTDLARFCKENGAAFLYVSAPSKIDRHDARFKALDFSNANADEFLAGLKANGVDYIDIRDNIDAEGLKINELFFRTDHHWLPETGLWATGIIAQYLNERGIIKSDVSLLNQDMWEKEVYKNYFLGSRGKKVTLQRATPDDITIYHPKFPTHLHIEIPSKAIARDGVFDITYDKKPLEKVDYYHANPYAAYSWGDKPYIYIRNEDAMNDKTLLMLKNSFGNVVYPFLALQFKNAYEVDVRHFNGSVREVIRQKKPDVVVVLHHIEYLPGKINYEWHNDLWDFR